MAKGNFTLPGESGYETLTLALAQRWGADVIRDSDGTQLSPEILEAGYGIYSTICPIREHNDWIRSHPESRQQTFLCTPAATAVEGTLQIPLLKHFFAEQMTVNDSADALRYWQVYDRTVDAEVPSTRWNWDAAQGTVSVQAIPFHQYTVSFLAWRVWEEISMYNHVTNHWDKEHLMQLNPYDPEAQTYLCAWLRTWCDAHPATTVVRFTSLFYNFAWIWSAEERNRYLFTDWASYDFTVCPAALDEFAAQYGYALCAEDFVRQGKYNATHRVPDQKKRDWMDFIGAFVRKSARELVDIVHEAGKQAYVFYDDSWVGLEPYNGHFAEFGFDGIIKCVFSGFEVRLCAGVPTQTHEIRFHPYLFPVGLGGAPTFAPGGHPGRDAFQYWVHARRALLRAKIERAGLGGYLHLVQDYPDFVEAMDTIMAEFRAIGHLHDVGAPASLAPRVGVLTAWGALRTWTLSGHFHETDAQVLMHVLESLSGLPFSVKFLSFEDVKQGGMDDVDVLLNAGSAGSAWSGGVCWNDAKAVEMLTQWVHGGGVYLGIGEPGAVPGYSTYLRMAHVLGVDLDNGERVCHGRWAYDVQPEAELIPSGVQLAEDVRACLTDGAARVLAGSSKGLALTEHSFGKGKGVYCADFICTPENTRFLQNLILYAATGSVQADGVTDCACVECTVYPKADTLVLCNNSDTAQRAAAVWQGKCYETDLTPYAMEIMTL